MGNIENENSRICAIYSRVSKGEQHPEKQAELLKTFSSQQNIKVYKVYTDITSGRKDTRPQLNNMLIDMRNGLFNCIVAYKLDRVGRSLKHLITICEELNNKGIDLIITSQNIDTKTASGKLLF
ncbi:MAG: recombinase family protein, partial [Candidatus Hodarchaeota archaeon]